MPNISGIDGARAVIQRGKRDPAEALPTVVAASWQRCIDLGLDPRSTPRDTVILFSDVARRREKIAALRRLALAEMQVLHSQIAGSNFMIALGDADGTVLDTISDQHFADSAAGRSIIPGSVWSEKEHGTNALGLAAMARQPVAIYGREHYFASHSHLSCMAAPILDTSGNILGLLDASCTNEARQQHTHALVRMAAAQIENGLIFQDRADSFILAFHPRAEYLDTLSAGLLAVSSGGKILSLNRPGSALLAGLSAATGRAFDTLFDTQFGVAIDGLLKGGMIRIRDRAGSAVFMICRQIGQREKPRPTSRTIPAQTDSGGIGFVCDDASIRRPLAELEEVVSLRMPVHITGETGTGKELMARHVHDRSGRKGEFVALNCGAVPENLFIAELFGHERGAYTDARAEGALGLARLADKGTLFLDEVADIPKAAQTALLRFLDCMEVRAIGGQKAHRVDVQIVSATNRPLSELVASHLFRADLYYRLNAFSIHLPPLGARQDFAQIVKHLVTNIAPEAAITDAAIAKLAQRAWPGNIRELQSILQRALVRRRKAYIDEDSFEDQAIQHEEDICPSCRPHPFSRRKCQEIRATYRTSENNIARTARLLGLSRTTIYKHLR